MQQRTPAPMLRVVVLVFGLSVMLAACDWGGFDPPGGGPDPVPTTAPSASPSDGTDPAPPASEPPASEPPASEPPANEVPEGYELVWSDEFDGTAVDTARWRVRDNDYAGYDKACITSRPDNVFVDDGILVLRAQEESFTCGSQHRGYTTGYLDTIGKASFTYGRFEVRAKSPTGPGNSTGLWPAFWLRPGDGGNGEIDVVELPGGSQYYDGATQAIHYTYSPGVKQDHRHIFASGHPADGFHTYTTEWEPGELRWYIDGEEVYRRDRSTTSWFDDAFSRDYNLRLNFQIGGWLGDPNDATAFPADFEVDYVRVWQK